MHRGQVRKLYIKTYVELSWSSILYDPRGLVGGQLICEAEITEMKIVNDISNYGWMANADSSNHVKLEYKVKPSEFSGPMHLKALYDKCFTFSGDDYKYELCPFHNLTQHERTMRWNPYSGLLGVWSEWDIKNNTFMHMIMKHGDECGKEHRQAKVSFSCGNNNSVVSVMEPKQCNYVINFTTPLVCHKDSMLVYPILNASLRHDWDKIEEDLANNILTQKGYEKYLSKLFFKAGFYVTVHDDNADMLPSAKFDTLEACNSHVDKLLREIESLKQELASKQC
ncbi:unnamed protein product [Clavelina lepadiformis]|uniref:N-acetylglucosamine-1-phosphotransferase subunit gamma n=1 Tax=Clavelina lepadiformis TaxID=159417 RepID=A0ABP0G157_CLALP